MLIFLLRSSPLRPQWPRASPTTLVHHHQSQQSQRRKQHHNQRHCIDPISALRNILSYFYVITLFHTMIRHCLCLPRQGIWSKAKQQCVRKTTSHHWKLHRIMCTHYPLSTCPHNARVLHMREAFRHRSVLEVALFQKICILHSLVVAQAHFCIVCQITVPSGLSREGNCLRS